MNPRIIKCRRTASTLIIVIHILQTTVPMSMERAV